MEINWYGYNCFGLKTKNGALVVDPYKNDVGLKLPNIKANVVVLSEEGNKSNNSEEIGGDPKVLTWPGEYEVAGIAITALKVAGTADSKKSSPSKAMMYSFDADGLKVCYISNFTAPISEELMESIGDVDVLIVPLNGNLEEIHKVIEEIEPRIVIPVGYSTPGLKADAGDLDTFLKKTGTQGVTPSDKFSVGGRSELPQEKTEYKILKPQNA